MRLLRLLLSAAARFNFTFTSQHIPGIHKIIADALSCFHWQEFRRLASWVQPYPVPVPHQLWDLLIPPLEAQCNSFLVQGLALSTRRVSVWPEEGFQILH